MARSPAEIEGAWRSVYKGPQCFIAGGFFALADEVHKQGLPLCRALAQRDLRKSCGSFRRRLFAQFVKNGTWYVPTTLIIIGSFFLGRRCKRLRSAGPSI